jgi:hypothetical protein
MNPNGGGGGGGGGGFDLDLTPSSSDVEEGERRFVADWQQSRQEEK